MTALLPCPRCQSESATGTVKHIGRITETWVDGSPVREEHFCNCIRCGLRSVGFKTEEEAIEHWNRRAQLVVDDAMVERATAAWNRTSRGGFLISMRAAIEAAMNKGEK